MRLHRLYTQKLMHILNKNITYKNQNFLIIRNNKTQLSSFYIGKKRDPKSNLRNNVVRNNETSLYMNFVI